MFQAKPLRIFYLCMYMVSCKRVSCVLCKDRITDMLTSLLFPCHIADDLSAHYIVCTYLFIFFRYIPGEKL